VSLPSPKTRFSDVLRFLAVASLGVFAGAMLTEGAVLVPYWRSLAPAEFFAWYAANDRRLLGFFGSLTTVAALLSVAAALASLIEGHPGRRLAALAAGLTIMAVATFFLYFEQANASFSAASVSADDLPVELARWAAWHWLRIGLSFAALAAALLASFRPQHGGAAAAAASARPPGGT
jgi:hypothetical protein